MSIREPPVANRWVDRFDRELSYRKHMTAVANAKTVLNTKTHLSSLSLSPSDMRSRRPRSRESLTRPRTRLSANPPRDLWEDAIDGCPVAFTEIPPFDREQPTPRAFLSPRGTVSRHESDDSDLPDPSDSSDTSEPAPEADNPPMGGEATSDDSESIFESMDDMTDQQLSPHFRLTESALMPICPAPSAPAIDVRAPPVLGEDDDIPDPSDGPSDEEDAS
jgi:hypothetical protein